MSSISKLKVLVNATSCVIGGGVQVASEFITWALREPNEIDFVFVVSSPVMENLKQTAQVDDRLLEVTPRPSLPWRGRRSRLRLRAVESSFGADVVFTVFGPAYTQFQSPHVCGFADGWVIHRSKIAMSVLSPRQRLYIRAVCKYKEAHLSSGDCYWVESEFAHRGLIRLLGLDSSQIRVIPNCYAEAFKKSDRKFPVRVTDSRVRIFCLAAPHPHKNLPIIPRVARSRRSNSKKSYRFTVTLPNAGKEVRRFWSEASRLGVRDMIENAGQLKLHECPTWYSKSHMVFLPTVLETFSVTYLESMVMGKAIVTTDLDFAHDICGKAAAYFNPRSPEDAANKIRMVAENTSLRDSLVEEGYKRLKCFPDPHEKYRMTLEWISEVATRAGRL